MCIRADSPPSPPLILPHQTPGVVAHCVEGASIILITNKQTSRPLASLHSRERLGRKDLAVTLAEAHLEPVALTEPCHLDFVTVLEELAGLAAANVDRLGPLPRQLEHRTHRLRGLMPSGNTGLGVGGGAIVCGGEGIKGAWVGRGST